MCDKPNYRHVQVQCCASCRHYRRTFEDEPICVEGLPPAEPVEGGWPRQEGAVTIQPLGICDAYAPQQGGPAAEQAFVMVPDIMEHKLDALGELLEAMAESVVASPSRERREALARLLARRRGQCEACLGTGTNDFDGMSRLRCQVCNGTGKAAPKPANDIVETEGGIINVGEGLGAACTPHLEDDPALGERSAPATVCTDRDCGHCEHGETAHPPSGPFHCVRRQRYVQAWDVCDDFHRRQGGSDGQ